MKEEIRRYVRRVMRKLVLRYWYRDFTTCYAETVVDGYEIMSSKDVVRIESAVRMKIAREIAYRLMEEGRIIFTECRSDGLRLSRTYRGEIKTL